MPNKSSFPNAVRIASPANGAFVNPSEVKIALRIVLWFGAISLTALGVLAYTADERTTLVKLLTKQRQEFRDRAEKPPGRRYRFVTGLRATESQ